MAEATLKRNIAYKFRIGTILAGKPTMEADRLKHVEIEGKNAVRVNIIANVIDKYIQDGEKKFGSLTMDDGTGQIKIKVFGEDIEDFTPLAQGDTILVIGLLRSWNNELYITPEIIKTREPAYLLVRKLELEAEKPKTMEKSALIELRDQIVQLVKAQDDNGGVDVESLVLNLKATPEIINTEIRKLLEEGMVYEPRPGKLRYLG